MFLHLGFAEITIISLVCILGIGLPAMISIFLRKMNSRIKSIEEHLQKDNKDV